MGLKDRGVTESQIVALLTSVSLSRGTVRNLPHTVRNQTMIVYNRADWCSDITLVFCSNLNAHLRVHTREWSSVWKVCKNVFTQRSNLITHLMSHSVEPSFSKQVEGNVHPLRKSKRASRATPWKMVFSHNMSIWARKLPPSSTVWFYRHCEIFSFMKMFLPCL
jgi:hypothetical protein